MNKGLEVLGWWLFASSVHSRERVPCFCCVLILTALCFPAIPLPNPASSCRVSATLLVSLSAVSYEKFSTRRGHHESPKSVLKHRYPQPQGSMLHDAMK